MLLPRYRWLPRALLGGWGALLVVFCNAAAAPSIQAIRGMVVDEKNAPIPDALCTLTGRLLPSDGLTSTTDHKGEFEFTGLQPAQYSLICAAAGRQPVTRALEVTENASPELDLVLPAEIVVHQTVEVHEQATTAAMEQRAAPTAKLSRAQFASLPLVEQKFKAALPYLPGVIRTPDGKINIEGAPESQGQLLVNSAETSDPVTGSQAIDVPVVAIDSLQVNKNAYDAQYGGFTAGLTTIHTRPPGERWAFEAQDVPPNPNIKGGHLVGMADFNPRVYVTGPLIANKLNFSEAVGYDIDKQPVRGLAWPHNEIWTHDFNSFTDFQYIFSAHHLATVTMNVFPLRRQYADIDSLIPQTASSNYSQHGFKITISDQYVTTGGGIFTTMIDGMKFDSCGRGQTGSDMLVTPNGWGGSFFNSYLHNSDQAQISETYMLPRLDHWGKHEWTLGAGLLNRNYHGSDQSQPVNILAPGGALTEQINFIGPGLLAAQDFEGSFFIADHWVPTETLSLDLGLRYSGQSLGGLARFAPRFGIAYSPGHRGKTIFRGGFGRFYAHTPLLGANFTLNPQRQVSYYDGNGNLQGAPVTYANLYGSVSRQGVWTTSASFPGNTPYNWTWNVEADRELRPRIMLRLNFMASRAYDQFIVNPVTALANGPAMVLSPHGAGRYNEFEATVRFRINAFADWNVSYVYSQARGDLNTLAQLFVPFEQPVIRPDVYSNLASDVPQRVLSWGRFKTHFWGIEAGPVADFHSGFPYAPIDMRQDYIGTPNTDRFPRFFSLDTKLAKEFRLPLPVVKKHLMRGSLTVFNLSNHSNPRDVFNNSASPAFGHFVGNQHRFLDTSLDVLY